MIQIADLFCGAGGTSQGAIEAIEALGHKASLTAVNHWDVAIATHTANHPTARHLCASVDDLNPRQLFREGELDLLWASPECTHHSTARGGKPISDQSRATAHCVTRWAEALRPPTILVENVPEFATWGPIGSNGRPLQSRKGETFQAWLALIRSHGYTVDYRLFCAADYGDPTTRERLIIQAQRGRRKIVWPDPTHAKPVADMFGLDGRKPWVPAADIIDWALPMPSIFTRKRPLAPNTLRRISEGLSEYGDATIIAMEHGGRAPTVSTAGALALVVEYYGNGKARPVTEPLPTVTCKDRFALIQATGGDIGFRMLRWHEIAAAQGFRRDYKFTGTGTQITKQIGNAVPRNLARAIALAAMGQRSDIQRFLTAA